MGLQEQAQGCHTEVRRRTRGRVHLRRSGQAHRRKVAITDAAPETTSYYYDGWQVIEEQDESQVLLQQYVYGRYIDGALVLDRNLDGDGDATGGGDQRLYYHQNGLYSTFALTDTSGTIVEAYQYDAYGGQTVFRPGDGPVSFGPGDIVDRGGASSVGNPYLFTGRRLDPETGLYFFRARYMNPVQGRFISRDPIGLGPNLARAGTLYTYVRQQTHLLGGPLRPPGRGRSGGGSQPRARRRRRGQLMHQQPPPVQSSPRRQPRVGEWAWRRGWEELSLR